MIVFFKKKKKKEKSVFMVLFAGLGGGSTYKSINLKKTKTLQWWNALYVECFQSIEETNN